MFVNKYLSYCPTPFVPSKVLFTGGSPTGWGSFIQGSTLLGTKYWSAEETQSSSSWRELVAIKFPLEPFHNHLADHRVACILIIKMFLESSRLVVSLMNHKISL